MTASGIVDLQHRLAARAPLASSEGAAGMRPMVLVGLGGVAARVLRCLRQRLARRFGDPALLPSLRFLAIDTDLAALREAESGEEGETLRSEETLHLPLRKTADYRSASDEILSWLSRRWLYNIPRSLQTEGLRPLGRLAFVDHRQTISQALRVALAQATAAESQELSSRTMRRAVRCPSPRVYVVTSIGGGAGGGMLLDVAYAVRQQLDQLGLPADDVAGLMLHATFAHSPANDLRKANAYATLTELNHFMRGGAAYRAGPLDVLPDGDVSEPPFADAYLLDLGDDLSEAAFDDALQGVAQYLYLDAATACGADLDLERRRTRPTPAAERLPPRLRSFGLHALRVDKHALAAREANRLGLRLTRNWLGESHDEQSLRDRLQPPDLTLDDLVGRVRGIADRALGGDAETHLRSLAATGSRRPMIAGNDDPGGPFGDELRRIHAVLGLPAVLEAAQAGPPSRFEAALRRGTGKLAAGMASSLVDSISALVERPQARLPAALAATGLFQERLRELRRSAEQVFRQDQSDAAALWSKLQRGELPRQRTGWFGRLGAAAHDPEERLLDYCRLRLRALLHQHVAAVVQEAAARIASLNDRLLKLRQSLEGLAAEFETALAAGEDRPSADRIAGEAELADELEQFADPTYVEQFDGWLQASMLAAQGGLLAFAEKRPDDWRALRAQLHERARERVLASLIGVDAGSLLLKTNPTIERLRLAVAAAAAEASPRLASAESAGRLLVVAPRGPSAEAILDAARQALPELSLTSIGDDGDLLFCREAEGVLLADAASAMVKGRGECAAAARRVLTRVDVPWTSLDRSADDASVGRLATGPSP